MADLIERGFQRLDQELCGRLSRPGNGRYAATTAIWAKPVGPMPRAIAHCRTAQDVQSTIRAARDCNLPLSVRGGGHDWAGRALCGGIVIDLTAINDVTLSPDYRAARISGGARASNVLAVTDPRGLAVVTGSCSSVGMTGLTLGGGYGSLIGRFGLALDNLIAAEVVLADGRIVTASSSNEQELFWALRGGGGNFGVVTSMQHRTHHLPSVHSGMLLFPFVEARAVLEGCIDIMAGAPEELTVQLGLVGGHDGVPLTVVVPTGARGGTPGAIPWPRNARHQQPGYDRLRHVARNIRSVPRDRTTCVHGDVLASNARQAGDRRLHSRDGDCGFTGLCHHHPRVGAASRVPVAATAFGLRRDHVLVEILASFTDRSEPRDEHWNRRWTQATLRAFDGIALPGGYPNLLAKDEVERAAKSYGVNAGRLIKAKQHYDPDNIFNSTIPLPTGRNVLAVE